MVLSEHDKAAQKKRKIEEAQNTQANSKVNESDDEENGLRKRDAKRLDKREMAVQKALKDQDRIGKDLKKSEGAGVAVSGKVQKVAIDQDLQSEEESEMGDDEEEGEFGDDDEEGEQEDDSDSS